jgi:TFIIH basal transcription factor complex TTD-A subunit
VVSIEDVTSSWKFLTVPHGVSDSAVKQILLSMNEKDPFIIEDLDEYHLIIKADEEYRVRKELEAEVRTPSSLSIRFQSRSFYLAGKEYVQLGGRSIINDH